ncbi:hypothetical protein H6G04_06215 [Calothrix membranacea FACHB-236]|nr:hypothetical protein [Calothrix membranacea FACHB-236]
MPANTINTNHSSHLKQDELNYEWHTLPDTEVVQTLASHSEAGLSHQEVTKRRGQRHNSNYQLPITYSLFPPYIKI